MLWRGAQMKQEWLKPYFDNISEFVKLPGSNSTSKNPCVALGFALDDKRAGFISTLFAITCQNYHKVQGTLMDNAALSAYPEEAEFLLMEGA